MCPRAVLYQGQLTSTITNAFRGNSLQLSPFVWVLLLSLSAEHPISRNSPRGPGGALRPRRLPWGPGSALRPRRLPWGPGEPLGTRVCLQDPLGAALDAPGAQEAPPEAQGSP